MSSSLSSSRNTFRYLAQRESAQVLCRVGLRFLQFFLSLRQERQLEKKRLLRVGFACGLVMLFS
jgi:hypothetical protein